MAIINPPDQKVPPSIAELDQPLFKLLQDSQFFDYQMWRSMLETTQVAQDASSHSGNAYQHKIQQQIGSGNFLTCDDTGFTCDSTVFTCDQSEA